MDINWKKALSLGFMLWALLFIIASALVSREMFSSVETTMYSTTFIILMSGVASYYFASKLELNSKISGLIYGVIWAVIGVLLDQLITNPFNHNMFSGVSYWTGYLLLVAAPILRAKNSRPVANVKPAETIAVAPIIPSSQNITMQDKKEA